MKRYALVYVLDEPVYAVKKYGGFVSINKDVDFLRHTLFVSKKMAEKMVADYGLSGINICIWEEDDVKRLAIKKALS